MKEPKRCLQSVTLLKKCLRSVEEVSEEAKLRRERSVGGTLEDACGRKRGTMETFEERAGQDAREMLEGRRRSVAG